MVLKKTYEMAKNPIPPIDWDSYLEWSSTEFRRLLDSNSPEYQMQSFFEQNPCFVPGAYGTQVKTGHAPMHFCLFTQPRLPGLAAKIPDFMWISKSSDHINPVLIEIEAPGKKFFNSDDSISSVYTKANTQILDWKAWFDKPENIQVFQREYRIDDKFQYNRRKIKPLFLLIYGRTSEMKSSQVRADRKAQLSSGDIKVMTYDRLSASSDQSSYFCGKAKSIGYEVAEFPEYVKLSPGFVEDFSIFTGQIEAIKKNNRISDQRKEFLLERLKYWNEWVKSGVQGMRNSGDKE